MSCELFDRSDAARVVWREVLWGVFSTFGQIAVLASCRKTDSGRYQHELVCALLGTERADHTLRAAHELAWREWADASLEQQQADLRLHLCEASEDREELLATWSKATFLDFIPDAASEQKRHLFTNNLSILLGLLRNQYCLQRVRVFPRAENALMERTLQILREEYADPELSLRSLAQRLHKSERQLGRVFRECLNHNFREYLGALRMERAIGLLVESAHDVKAIAGMVGYRDANYFSRDFRERMGCTPGEFRAKSKTSTKGKRPRLSLAAGAD